MATKNTVNTIGLLYTDAKVADDAYQFALEEAFGKEAGDMRYAKVLPSHLALLRIAKRKADAAYLEAIERDRLAKQ